MLQRLRRPENLLPLLYFALLWAHGATLGPTDDEAYYWVLAQRPALGYAYHPPMVAWSLGLSWLFGSASTALLRLPAALYASGTLAFALRWLKRVGAGGFGPGLVVLSFAGLFGSAWMMVPDLPLLFAWMAMFLLTHRLCFGQGGGGRWEYALLGAATTMAILSKFSGVIAAGCAGLALLVWAPPRIWKRAWAAIIAGALVAAVPILVWNARHEWGALLYQFHDRHAGAGFDLKRWARFWVIEAVLAGPPLIVFAFRHLRREPALRYLSMWIIPHLLVFGAQPAFSDFKPHWAFVIWLPAALGLAWRFSRGESMGWARAQLAYGFALSGLALLACQWPLIGWIGPRFVSGPWDPRWDVTNDLYGWEQLPGYLREPLPVVGSRYQTAAQAAFALGDANRVTLVPRDAKSRDEWPDLGVADEKGRLLKPVYFVADFRYNAGPPFEEARCAVESRWQAERHGVAARSVEVYRCDPLLTPGPRG